MLRLAVGSLFIMSGLAKLIDLWGFIYKIEEYLGLWGLDQPRSLVFIASFLISGFEFVVGLMVLLGCYKRSAPGLLLCMMAVMLPLTLYIYIVNPVADCGCFGDFWKISNGATFWKNVAIVLGLILLSVYNRRVDGLFRPPTQWLVVTVTGVYALIIGLIGYYIQPMVDFRSFPPGTSLIGGYSEDSPNSEDSDDTAEFVFIYENSAGERREFSLDDIPEEGWTFVDRKQVGGVEAIENGPTDFVVLREDEDITSEIVTGRGVELLLLIPDIFRADVAYTYPLNELNDYLRKNGGRMVALIASDRKGLDYWRDLSMASYPLFTAEPTLIKELGRGDMSLVFLKDGRVVWKRALIDPDRLSLIPTVSSEPAEALEETDPELFHRLVQLTLLFVGVLFVLWLIDRSGYRIYLIGSRGKRKGQKLPS